MVGNIFKWSMFMLMLMLKYNTATLLNKYAMWCLTVVNKKKTYKRQAQRREDYHSYKNCNMETSHSPHLKEQINIYGATLVHLS